ncbi:MAG: tetratricopeptide repeat protein [Oceanihabitans sp.]
MKKLIVLTLILASCFVNAQTKTELQKHYEAYYKQMKTQGDMQGIINSLTHLNIIAPSQARKDTLAYLYMSANKYNQALNTIGIDSSPSDSNLAVEVKAVSLKSLNQPERSLVHFKEMHKRKPTAFVAYELAELSMQVKNLPEAVKYINYGLENVKDDMKKAFYETKQPYQVSLKAAFIYLKGLAKYNENNTENLDAAIAIFDQALKLEPNFNLAQLSKEALQAQKKQP